jgi:hypothetical protein
MLHRLRRLLKPLAEMFDVKLYDFQIGHVVTYQTQRATEMDLIASVHTDEVRPA